MNRQVDIEAGQEASEAEALPQGELLIGTLVEFDTSGSPRVRVAWEGSWHTLTATPAVSVNAQHLGRQAVLMLAGGQIQAPVLLGFVYSPLDSALEQALEATPANEGDSDDEYRPASREPVEAEVDGDRTVIDGNRQVVLRCGEASITLTHAGKIILRGKHLVSRSSGVNRIMGGSIQMN